MYPDTFSQFDEQQAILAYFKQRYDVADDANYPESVRFLDIGAWSPTVFSNTRALFERGCSGVMIEFSPGPMIGLLKEYGNEPRIRLVQAAVTTGDAIVRMRISDDGLSSNDPAHLEKWKEKGGYYATMDVLGVTWDEINNWFGGFDFVSIDTEGTSVDLFRAMLDSGVLPHCCCVEHDDRMSELCALATAKSYKLLYSNGTNAVFGR